MPMIDLEHILANVPHAEKFASVAELQARAEQLRGKPGFLVEVAGVSVGGKPIHHVTVGKGQVTALFVGGPHAMEPMGSLTILALLDQLEQNERALLDLDVTWHVIPCIDPDGAVLNEAWTQQPFEIASYVRNLYIQPRPEQVEFSFPIAHEQLIYDGISHEAAILRGILDTVRPDFFFSLHNFGIVGGAWFALSRDIGCAAYDRIGALLDAHGMPLQGEGGGIYADYAPGMREIPTFRKYYDHLKAHGLPIPEELLQGKTGASSQEYLLDINPHALVFVAELTHGTHPSELSDAPTTHNLRQLKLHVDADEKFLTAALVEAWDAVEADLDPECPYYRKIAAELIAARETLHEGVTAWYVQPIQLILGERGDNRIARERDVIEIYRRHSLFLANAHVFLRMLMAACPSTSVTRAITELAPLFDTMIANLEAVFLPSGYRSFSCTALARAQFGAGLIALDACLRGAADD